MTNNPNYKMESLMDSLILEPLAQSAERDISEYMTEVKNASLINNSTSEETVLPTNILDEYFRHTFLVDTESEDFDSLLSSISAQGIICPITVRPSANGRYEILSGHRRVAAAKRLNMPNVPVLIINVSDDEADLISIDSNIVQRKNHKTVELVRSFELARKAIANIRIKQPSLPCFKGKKTSAVIGTYYGIADRTVREYLSLSCLTDEYLAALDCKLIRKKDAMKYLINMSERHRNVLFPYIQEKRLIANSHFFSYLNNNFIPDSLNDNAFVELIEKYISGKKDEKPENKERTYKFNTKNAPKEIEDILSRYTEQEVNGLVLGLLYLHRNDCDTIVEKYNASKQANN